MTLRTALLAATMLTLPVAAGAQSVAGLYVGAGAGINLWLDSSSHGLRVHDADIGAAALGSIGWGFGNGLRAEIEGNYRVGEISLVVGPDLRPIGSSGYLRNYGVMANALYDFDVGTRGFTPYLGIGLGYVWSEIYNARLAVGTSRYQINDTDGNFAYQAIIGGAFGLGDMVPGLAVTAEARYFGTLEPSFGVTRVSGPARADVPTELKLHNSNISVLLGLRYNFGAPRPAPAATPVAPAPAAPQIARTYLVFFDWDRADLTDRARQ
ncbi:MAG: outer membrane beta-barrel protein, partial [Acetobacteraceae bacterium]|nr:outer membrane beta-barrel protein [Acetobacteraceae bacterium]